MATIATLDLKSIYELYLEVKKEFSGYSERYLYFLATCFYLDPDLDLDNALKIRPYDGLIGIDNSTLDKYFKSYTILRLHAILQDTSGFVFEQSKKGPSYSYGLPCPVTSEYLGHVTGIAFCLYVKSFVQFIGMLKLRPVVLDIEGFRHKKSGIKIKELSVCTHKYIDTVSFRPPSSFNIHSSSEQKSYQWVLKFLHGLA